MNSPEQATEPVASFPGRRRNGMATATNSNRVRMIRHSIAYLIQAVKRTVNMIVPSAEKGPFLLVEATVCC